MRKILKTELHRAFCCRAFFVILGLGMVFVIWHTVQYKIPYTRSLGVMSHGEEVYPHNVYQECILGNSMSVHAYIYSMCLPVLAALPFGASACQDRQSGYRDQILSRTARSAYYRAKWIAAFLSGAAVVVLPMIWDFLVTLWFFPVLSPDSMSRWDSVGVDGMMAGIYYHMPMLYMLAKWLFLALFGGIFAVLSLTAGMFAKNSVVVLLTPVLIQLLYQSATSFLNARNWQFVAYYTVYQPLFSMRLWKPLLAGGVLLAASLLLYAWRAREKDVLKA